MDGIAEVGNTVIMTREFLSEFIDQITQTATREGVSAYQENLDKHTVLSTLEAGEILDCTPKTVIKYIQKGHKNAGKLPATLIGKIYKVNNYDLKQFKSKIKFG